MQQSLVALAKDTAAERPSAKFDIVDSQIHLFHTMGLEAGLACMDSLGIAGAIVDEIWGLEDDGSLPPYIDLGGAKRSIGPNAQAAAMKHPDRLRYILRLDPNDPDLESWARLSAADPNCVGFRADVRFQPEIELLVEGGYARLFRTVADLKRPLFVCSGAPPAAIDRYFEEFTEIAIIMDHCGRPANLDQFQDVLALARHPNAYLKWCHPHYYLHIEGADGAPALPYLRRAIAAFGADRITWASDFTIVRRASGHSWSDCLEYIRTTTELSDDEKAWILGRTVRKLTGWER